MDALLLAILNALWQGAALIALVALGLRAGLRRNATTACVVWSITFVVVALLPAIDLALAHPQSAAPAAVPQPAAIALRIADTARAAPAPAGAASRLVNAPSSVPQPSDLRRDAALRVGGWATAFAHAWGFVLVALWALIAGALVFRLVAAYATIARMKRDATPLDDQRILGRLRAAGHLRRATVACSDHIEIPCAVGFRRPMILVPSRLASALDAEDLARVVLHESAHLQRYDDWINALEQFVCALQFFQPALYLARRSIDFEREVACDDRVLEDAGEPLRYAECLARIVQRHVRGRQAAVVPGFVLRRTQVVARVRRIVDRSRDASPHLRVAAVVLSGGVLIATLGIARLQVPLVASAVAAPLEEVAPYAVGGSFGTAAAPKAVPTPAPRSARRPAAAVVAQVPAPEASPSPSPSPSPVPSPVVPYAKPVAHRAPAAVTLSAEERRTLNHVSTRASAIVAEQARASASEIAVQVAAEAALPSSTIVHARRTDGDLLDAIAEAKYPRPSVDELIALRNQGVSADYIRRMGAIGRGRPSLHDLMQLATQGVSPEYVGTLDKRLATAPTLDEIVALRVQGVTAAWLDGMAAIGYAKLRPGDATALAVQGVSVSYVRGMLDAGLRSITPGQLLELRVQGVDGTFVRRLAEHGYRNLTIDELVRLKVSGFAP